MRGAIPPLLNTPSWHGAQLKKSTETTSPLPFTVSSLQVRELITKQCELFCSGAHPYEMTVVIKRRPLLQCLRYGTSDPRSSPRIKYSLV
jgi:hypothetical protein